MSKVLRRFVGYVSDIKEIEYCVLQGSVLGAVLFLLYI